VYMLRSLNLFYCFLTLLASFVAQAQTIVQGELAEKLDAYMTDVASNGFSGVILIAKGSKVILSKGYGMVSRTENIPITPDSVFDIGSITKQFTATAILQLEEQGKLSVNDPITKYFENVPKDKQNITLHHLLTHTSGLPAALGGDYDVIERSDYSKAAMFAPLPLLYEPGDRFEYSNVGFSLLAIIVELVSGQPYEAYLQEHLFEPAGMKKTGYVLPQWEDAELVHGYFPGDEDWGSPLDHAWAEDGPYWNLRGNGGILSTAEDMYKWHLALEGEAVLSAEAKEKLYTPHIRAWDGDYGYGWFIYQTPRGLNISHGGANGIFHADFHRYLDANVVFYIASNDSSHPAFDLSYTIAEIIFNE
jgi:CubicO group peptidase (beta-lactamase class C family)